MTYTCSIFTLSQYKDHLL